MANAMDRRLRMEALLCCYVLARPLLDLRARELDNLFPLVGFGLHDLAEPFRCGDDRHAAEFGEALLDHRLGKDIVDRLVEDRDDLGRRALRRSHPEPSAGLVA